MDFDKEQLKELSVNEMEILLLQLAQKQSKIEVKKKVLVLTVRFIQVLRF